MDALLKKSQAGALSRRPGKHSTAGPLEMPRTHNAREAPQKGAVATPAAGKLPSTLCFLPRAGLKIGPFGRKSNGKAASAKKGPVFHWTSNKTNEFRAPRRARAKVWRAVWPQLECRRALLATPRGRSADNIGLSATCSPKISAGPAVWGDTRLQS